MAKSPSHSIGQIIGNIIEDAVVPVLSDFCNTNKLYIDKKGARPARKGLKVCWCDKYGNNHDLDYVIEKNGTDTNIGTPIAFIEVAYRRYTKHSRNKAQEIQGAIIPLSETFYKYLPFLGAILAGEFTTGALEQLKSSGFNVIYFEWATIVRAFKSHGIDVGFEENTPTEKLNDILDVLSNLSVNCRCEIGATLVDFNRNEVDTFMANLNDSVMRQICNIIVTVLHGTPVVLDSVEDAIQHMSNYNDNVTSVPPIHKFEIIIRYNNGDNINAQFSTKEKAILFLKGYRS